MNSAISTDGFVNITYHGIVDSFDSRNAVPFPEPVIGRHCILLRFHPDIHLGFLEAGMDQLLDPSRHKERWEEIYEWRSQNLLLEAGQTPHEKEKIGPGPQVIRTDIPSAPYELYGDEQYAPVIRQGAITNQDYITAVDFEGDWVGSNNGCRLENQPTGDLSAGAYYSVVDSKTHLRQLWRFHSRVRSRPYLADRTGGGVSRRYTVVLQAWRSQ